MDNLRQFLSTQGIKLNTDLGQHFLIDESILEQIIEAAQIQQGERIVEIGPGVGVLTRELLKKGARVTAIELDDRLIPLLKEFVKLSIINYPASAKATAGKQLSIIHGNALSVEFPNEHYKVVANIPYHITSPLLRHIFLESKTIPSSMTLLIQREVAEKIADTKDAGMLTILVALFGKARLVTRVPPAAFLPPPKVDSAVLQIDCYKEPKADQETIERIFTLTKIAFGQKRKMLRNTLSTLPGGPEALQNIGIDPSRRPQTLSIDEWIALARVWNGAVPPSNGTGNS